MKLLRIPEVMSLTGKCRSSVYGDPTFPKPIRIGKRAAAWVEAEVNEWIADRIAERDGGEELTGGRRTAARRSMSFMGVEETGT